VLERQLSVSLSAPQVSVVLMAKRKLEVSVLGEVTNPGKYPIDPRDGMAAALALAGGLSEFADEDSIYLVRESSPRIRFRMLDLVSGGAGARLPLRDGDLVVVE
jgi:polysaccharide export outer membrane protein